MRNNGAHVSIVFLSTWNAGVVREQQNLSNEQSADLCDHKQ